MRLSIAVKSVEVSAAGRAHWYATQNTLRVLVLVRRVVFAIETTISLTAAKIRIRTYDHTKDIKNSLSGQTCHEITLVTLKNIQSTYQLG